MITGWHLTPPTGGLGLSLTFYAGKSQSGRNSFVQRLWTQAEPRGDLGTKGSPGLGRRPRLTPRVTLPGCWSLDCRGWNLLPVPFPRRPSRLHLGFSKHTIVLPTNNDNCHAFLKSYTSYFSFLPPHFG